MGDKTLWCLVDTGATKSVISQELWNLIRAKNWYTHYVPINQTATVIDGHEVQCIGLAQVKIKVKNEDRVLPFLVMPKFSRDILFGVDNLREIKYSISWDHHVSNSQPEVSMYTFVDPMTKARNEIQAELCKNSEVKGPTTLAEHKIKVKPGVEPIKFSIMGGDNSSSVIQEGLLEEELRALEAVVVAGVNSEVTVGEKKESKGKKNLKQVLFNHRWEQQKQILKRQMNKRLEEHKLKRVAKSANLSQTIARLHKLANDRNVPEESGCSKANPTTKKDFTRHATIALTDRRRDKWALESLSAAPVQRRSVGKPINQAASGKKAILIDNPPLPARTKKSIKLRKEVNPGRVDPVQASGPVVEAAESKVESEVMEVDPPSQLNMKEVAIFPPNQPVVNLLPRSGLVIGAIPHQRVREVRAYEPIPITGPAQVVLPAIASPAVNISDPMPSTFCSQKRKRKPRSNRQQRHVRVNEDGMLIQSYRKKDGTLVEYVKGPDTRQPKGATQPKKS
ncbi:hypothetical protein KQX54_011375 [Cotesia glomerata]|uniref:Peptidase A2 domain-containing protein n=1 Tax=Cotesia glomerata TaxID=32391 RepID=A0AAV7IRU9_COTGL|nr:hypothetical protein KQX54_011375 [Cotesia glomerata]